MERKVVAIVNVLLTVHCGQVFTPISLAFLAIFHTDDNKLQLIHLQELAEVYGVALE